MGMRGRIELAFVGVSIFDSGVGREIVGYG